jgi:hypothetical protein
MAKLNVARALLSGTRKTMKQIEEQGMKGIGKNQALNSFKKPVCVFGWIVFHAGLLPNVIEKHEEGDESKRKGKKRWEDGLGDNAEAAIMCGMVKTQKTQPFFDALNALTGANDEDKRSTPKVVGDLKALEAALKELT